MAVGVVSLQLSLSTSVMVGLTRKYASFCRHVFRHLNFLAVALKIVDCRINGTSSLLHPCRLEYAVVSLLEIQIGGRLDTRYVMGVALL